MPSPTMPVVTEPLLELLLYGRPGCHLCEDAHAALEAILVQREALGLAVPPLVQRDIESDPAWLARYAFTIPVVAIGGRELELATSPAKLVRFLAAALDAS